MNILVFFIPDFFGPLILISFTSSVILILLLRFRLVTIDIGFFSLLTIYFPKYHRGNLNLMIVPSSDFRLSFIGDNGHVERLFTLSNRVSSMAIIIDEIRSDQSGRSFVIKANDQDVYFWCSEKSKLLGMELLLKVFVLLAWDLNDK